MHFGKKLKLLRKNAKITQTELSEKLNITTRTIINYETCKCYPKQTEIYAHIASIFDVTVDSLMCEDQNVYKKEKYYKNNSLITATKLTAEITRLIKSDELTEKEKDKTVRLIIESYWESKKLI